MEYNKKKSENNTYEKEKKHLGIVFSILTQDFSVEYYNKVIQVTARTVLRNQTKLLCSEGMIENEYKSLYNSVDSKSLFSVYIL